MLWIGPSLGAVERACMRSVLRHGHPLRLYCYEPPEGVPEGVELADAAEIVPAKRIIRHKKSGSVALFANLFRYELQRLGRGIWLDCDTYLLAPLDGQSPYLMGAEDARGGIGIGVLRLPPDSPILAPLIDLYDETKVPPWIPLRARAAAWWRRIRTGRTGLSMMPWGVAGPKAVTVMVRRYRLNRHTLPPEVFYPVRWQEAEWICDPAIALEDLITPNTVAIHLWNEQIKHFKGLPARPGSFLARLQQEGA
jgi:hypothetical protein